VVILELLVLLGQILGFWHRQLVVVEKELEQLAPRQRL